MSLLQIANFRLDYRKRRTLSLKNQPIVIINMAYYRLYLRSHTELETRLAVYRVTLVWAASRSDSFVMKLIPDIYDIPEDEAQLRSLGKVTIISQSSSDSTDINSNAIATTLQNSVKQFATLAENITLNVGEIPKQIIEVKGEPRDEFVQKLTKTLPSQKAVTGELCPVEDLDLYAGTRPILRLRDYGSIHSIDLIEAEAECLRQALLHTHLDPSYLIESPQFPANYL